MLFAPHVQLQRRFFQHEIAAAPPKPLNPHPPMSRLVRKRTVPGTYWGIDNPEPKLLKRDKARVGQRKQF